MSRKAVESLPPGCYFRGKTIWGRFILAGLEHRRSLRTSNPKEAQARLESWRQKIHRQEFELDNTHSFKLAVLKWEAEVLPEAVKPSVMRRYMTSITALVPVFGDLNVKDINSKAIARYISTRTGTVTNATIRRDLTALSRLLAACIAWGWISDNPAKTFDTSIIRERRKQMSIPSDADFATVLAFVPAGAAPILRLLDQTGMRMQEATTLEWPEIKRDLKQILLIKTKTNRPRTLNWQTPGGDAGPVLVGQKADKAYIFPSGDDVPYHSFSSVIGNAMRSLVAREKEDGRSFRRFRVHDLRHRFAIRWLKAGGDIYRLSRHLGHSSVAVTEIYLRYLTDDEVDAIRGVAQNRAQHPDEQRDRNDIAV